MRVEEVDDQPGRFVDRCEVDHGAGPGVTSADDGDALEVETLGAVSSREHFGHQPLRRR
jgi:hypothetical protein